MEWSSGDNRPILVLVNEPLDRPGTDSPRSVWGWLLVNGLGLALYAGLEVRLVLSRADEGTLDPIALFVFWCQRVLPVLAVAWIINLVWAIQIARGPSTQRNRQFAWWLVVFLIWCAALSYKGFGILSLVF